MSRRAVCARLEAGSLPCCCRRRAGLCPRRQSSSIVSLLARSDVLTKVVLLILALFSIVSWSIILYKLGHSAARNARAAAFSMSSGAATSSRTSRPSADRSATVRWWDCFRQATRSSRRNCGSTPRTARRLPIQRRPPVVLLSRAWPRSIARCCARRRSRSTSSNAGFRFLPRRRASHRSSGCSGPCGAS